jgi:hypothetical protein
VAEASDLFDPRERAKMETAALLRTTALWWSRRGVN